MKTIIFSVIATIILTQLLLLLPYGVEQQKEISYGDMSFHPNRNICFGTGTGMTDVKITVQYFDDPKLQGSWDEKTYVMSLNDTDVDTIAHETYHAVDTIYREKGFTDEHFKAYMEGQIAQCVYDIVN